MNDTCTVHDKAKGFTVYLHVSYLSSKVRSAGMRRFMCGPNDASEYMLHAYNAAGQRTAAFVLSFFVSFFSC
jgi:hypothetical protein